MRISAAAARTAARRRSESHDGTAAAASTPTMASTMSSSGRLNPCSLRGHTSGVLLSTRFGRGTSGNIASGPVGWAALLGRRVGGPAHAADLALGFRGLFTFEVSVVLPLTVM